MIVLQGNIYYNDVSQKMGDEYFLTKLTVILPFLCPDRKSNA